MASSETPRPSRWRRFFSTYRHELWYTWKVAKRTLAIFLVGHIFMEHGLWLEATYGISMLPNIAASGDWVYTSKYYRRGRGVKVGDLVTFRHPMDERVMALKRVVGMPGDFVLRDTPHKGQAAMIQVPEGHCYVVGDNLTYSRDSRLWGPLPLALIMGKAVSKTILWPWPLWPRRIGGGLRAADDTEVEWQRLADH